MKRLKSLTFLVIVALVLGAVGCNILTPPSQQGGQPTTAAATASAPAAAQKSAASQPTQQPAATQPTPKPPAAQPTSEQEDLEVVLPEMADNITSFREKMTMLSTRDGQAQMNWNSLTEWVKSIPARRTVVEMAGEDEQIAWEMIQIGDVSYMRIGDEWIVSTGTEEPPTNEWAGFANPEAWKDDPACSYKGQEVINGMQTKRWDCTKEVFTRSGAAMLTGETIEEGKIESWASIEFDVVVKMAMEWQGTDEDGKKVTFKLTTETYDINKPFTIEAPEGVEKPSLPDDIPMMDGASNMMAVAQMVRYEVSASVQDGIDFYTAAMPDNGWEAGEEGFVPGMLDFAKDARKVQVMITEESATTIAVTIMMTEE